MKNNNILLGSMPFLINLKDFSSHSYEVKGQRAMDNNAKGGLTQFQELLTVIPCAPKDFKR